MQISKLIQFRFKLIWLSASGGHCVSLINKTCHFTNASYTNTQNTEVQLHLNKNDVVTIQVADYGESYAIIKGIFKHKSNDGYYYPFIYVDWFEDAHQNHDDKLNCPLYSLYH